MSYDEKDEERIDSDSLSETIEKETEATPPSDRFTQLMFGNRVPNNYREQHNSQEKQVEDLLKSLGMNK